jgi:N12 class adenine-specific DNA methylase
MYKKRLLRHSLKNSDSITIAFHSLRVNRKKRNELATTKRLKYISKVTITGIEMRILKHPRITVTNKKVKKGHKIRKGVKERNEEKRRRKRYDKRKKTCWQFSKKISSWLKFIEYILGQTSTISLFLRGLFS